MLICWSFSRFKKRRVRRRHFRDSLVGLVGIGRENALFLRHLRERPERRVKQVKLLFQFRNAPFIDQGSLRFKGSKQLFVELVRRLYGRCCRKYHTNTRETQSGRTFGMYKGI